MPQIDLGLWALLTVSNADNGLDSSYIAGGATLLGAVIAGLVAVTVYAHGQRAIARDRKRQACGEAIGSALAWLELPYRVRRRLDDRPETIRAMTERIHDLQESILRHSSWLQVESAEASADYNALVEAIKDATRQPIQEAWRTTPSLNAADMNIGELNIDRSVVERRLSALTRTIRREFG